MQCSGLGMAMVSVSWLIAVYYNVIIAQVLLFLFVSIASIGSELPWTRCDNWWNTPNCLEPDYLSDDSDESTTEMTTMSMYDSVTRWHTTPTQMRLIISFSNIELW